MNMEKDYKYTDKGFGELIDTHQVAEKVFGGDNPVTRRKLFNLIKQKRFPQPITVIGDMNKRGKRNLYFNNAEVFNFVRRGDLTDDDTSVINVTHM
jgi:hypothetical protein